MWNRVNGTERQCRNGKNLTEVQSTLGLNRWTPSFILLTETNRKTIRIKAGRRAMKFEEGIKTSTGRLIPEECLKRRKGT